MRISSIFLQAEVRAVVVRVIRVRKCVLVLARNQWSGKEAVLACRNRQLNDSLLQLLVCFKYRIKFLYRKLADVKLGLEMSSELFPFRFMCVS